MAKSPTPSRATLAKPGAGTSTAAGAARTAPPVPPAPAPAPGAPKVIRQAPSQAEHAEALRLQREREEAGEAPRGPKDRTSEVEVHDSPDIRGTPPLYEVLDDGEPRTKEDGSPLLVQSMSRSGSGTIVTVRPCRGRPEQDFNVYFEQLRPVDGNRARECWGYGGHLRLADDGLGLAKIGD